MEFEQRFESFNTTSSTMTTNVVDSCDDIVVSSVLSNDLENSLSTDLCNDEDPFAPIQDLDDLFADEGAEKKPQGSFSVQPRPLQDMVGSVVLGSNGLLGNWCGTSKMEGTTNAKPVVEDVLSAVMRDLANPFCGSEDNVSSSSNTFQAMCNDRCIFTAPHDIPSTAMNLLSSAEALLADDILAEIPRTEFDMTTSAPRRERFDSLDYSELFGGDNKNAVSDESIASIVKSVDESLQASLVRNTSKSKKRPSVVSSCSSASSSPITTRPTKRSKVDSHMDEFDDSSAAGSSAEDDSRFRNYQTEKWMTKFDELVEFKKANGHCQVPHSYKDNLSLGRWAKRQRYQYKLYREGKPSTMCEDRIASLEKLGFVWDSHSALWEERYKELLEFYVAFGHSNVPSSFPPNPKLAIWVKCQRRQRKLLVAREPSNMTLTRVDRLNKLNFVWEVRKVGI